MCWSIPNPGIPRLMMWTSCCAVAGGALGAEDRAALETFKRQDRADLPSVQVGYGTHPDVTITARCRSTSRRSGGMLSRSSSMTRRCGSWPPRTSMGVRLGSPCCSWG
jgi:hypothetical protein